MKLKMLALMTIVCLGMENQAMMWNLKWDNWISKERQAQFSKVFWTFSGVWVARQMTKPYTRPVENWILGKTYYQTRWGIAALDKKQKAKDAQEQARANEIVNMALGRKNKENNCADIDQDIQSLKRTFNKIEGTSNQGTHDQNFNEKREQWQKLIDANNNNNTNSNTASSPSSSSSSSSSSTVRP